MRPVYYILDSDGKTPIPVSPVEALGWGDNQVADDYCGDVRVTTVFLSIDHQCGDGPPLLWETMIFGGKHDQYQERYSTYEEALEGHKRALMMVAQ